MRLASELQKPDGDVACRRSLDETCAVPHCLSLAAYRAIARMVERSSPFDVELALLLVQEVSQELRLAVPASGDRKTSVPLWPRGGAAELRAGLARRGVTFVIAEIDRLVGDAPGAV